MALRFPGGIGRRGLLFGLGFGLLLTAGCGRRQEPAPATPAEPVEARASVDRAVATTGDLITYTISVDHDPAFTIELPEPGAEIAGFRVVDLGRKQPGTVAGRKLEERWYKLRADLVGSYVLPPVTVGFTGPGTGTDRQTVSTSAIFVEVESVLPAAGEAAATDVRDLKPLRPEASRIPWLAIAGGLALAVAALVAWWWWRRRPRPIAPQVPAHEIAFQALDELRGTDFKDKAAVRRFHFRISEVLRTYVEGRYGLNATDLTSEEILAALPALPSLDPEQGGALRRFLRATDQVKFADYEPVEDEIRATYDIALSFVESTRPVAEPAPAGQREAA